MNRTFKRKKQALILYCVAVVLFVVFFLCIGSLDGISVFQGRAEKGSTVIQDFSQETVVQQDAPAGVQNVYRWVIDREDCGGSHLCFYASYASVEVYIQQELVYRLTPQEGNLLSRGSGNNWVCIPLYHADYGKEVTILLTPDYKNTVHRDIRFLMGSKFDIFMECLADDCVDLILSIICIFMGIFISISNLHLYFKKMHGASSMFFLGNFSVILGLWRISDVRSITFLLPDHSLLLCYLTFGALCLCVTPLLLFMREELYDVEKIPLYILSLVTTCTALLILALQVLGIAEFRETLLLCHTIIVLTALTTFSVLFFQLGREKASPASTKYAFLLAIGLATDLISYYALNSKHELIFTVISFVVYLLILFSKNTTENSKLIYTDSLTGLFNRTRWDELIHSRSYASGSVSIIMMDLNGLKQTNDELGHEEGDRMIFLFANILRNTLPSDSVICRWGGDEFGIMLTKATREMVQQAIDKVRWECDRYNADENAPFLSFSAGFALSSEHPNLSKQALWEEADAQMYQEKQPGIAKHNKKQRLS